MICRCFYEWFLCNCTHCYLIYLFLFDIHFILFIHLFIFSKILAIFAILISRWNKGYCIVLYLCCSGHLHEWIALLHSVPHHSWKVPLRLMAFGVAVWVIKGTYSSATFLTFSSSWLWPHLNRARESAVLATRLVFNSVIKNLHTRYPAFNAGRGLNFFECKHSNGLWSACEPWSPISTCETHDC